MDFLASLVSGVVGGVIVTVFNLIFYALWRKVLMPWFEERQYSSVRIEGKWRSSYELDGIVREGYFFIERFGHSIVAHSTLLTGPEAGATFTASGKFSNLILTATYGATRQDTLDRGAVALMLWDNGNRMSGHLICYSNAHNRIESVAFECYKDRGQAPAVPSTGSTGGTSGVDVS